MANGIAPVVFSYHEDIDQKLQARFKDGLQTVSYSGLGFNPMEVVGDAPLSFMDDVAMLRDNFAIFPDLGDIRIGAAARGPEAKLSTEGWAAGKRGKVPPFDAFYATLAAEPKPDRGLMTRLSELSDYGLFDETSVGTSLLDNDHAALVPSTRFRMRCCNAPSQLLFCTICINQY